MVIKPNPQAFLSVELLGPLEFCDPEEVACLAHNFSSDKWLEASHVYIFLYGHKIDGYVCYASPVAAHCKNAWHNVSALRYTDTENVTG